jgi:hypothetical protein
MAMNKKRIWARQNPDKSTAWERAGHASEEAYKEYQKAYYKKNKERILQKKKEDKFNYILNHSKKRAKEKGLEHTIDREYLESIYTDTCPIFNVKFIYSNKLNDWSMTLDRIDPTKGYIKGNVQFLSSKANRMKSNATHEEIIKFCEYFIDR